MECSAAHAAPCSARLTRARWVFSFLLLAAAALLPAAEPAPGEKLIFPGTGTSLFGPDDALEFVISLGEAPTSAALTSSVPEIRAWLIEVGQPAPGADQPSQGLVQLWPSPTRSREWLVHLRGLAAPRTGPGAPAAWDLLVRWRLPAAGGSGPWEESRRKDALAFRAGLPDVVLLMDGSTSMALNDPERLRVEAARMFVRLGLRSGGIGRVAVLQFDDRVHLLLPLTPLKESEAFERALGEICESGQTDIDGGIRKALELLGAAGGVLVLLSDGKQEPGEYHNAHQQARAAGVPIHTVALGRSADRTLLARIAQETGGLFSEADRDQDLLRLYGSIASRIAGGRAILTVELPAAGGRAEFPCDGSCRMLTASVRAARPGELALKGPDEREERTRVEAHPVQFIQRPAAGPWQALYACPAAQAADAPARLEAAAHTALFPLLFRARPGADEALELDAADPRLALSLAEGAARLAPAEVTVTLTGPGAPLTVRLRDDGTQEDGAAGDGVYAGALPETWALDLPDGTTGRLLAVVSGVRAGGEPYRREAAAKWVLRRTGRPALIATGTVNFGARYAGDGADGEIRVRAVGANGALAVLSVPPDGGVRDLSSRLRVTAAPARLRAREQGALALRLEIPEGLPPGVCGGGVDLKLTGGPGGEVAARVPWLVNVKAAELLVVPARLDLGAVPPGAQVRCRLSLATRGGRLALLPPVFAGGGTSGPALQLPSPGEVAASMAPLQLLRAPAGLLEATVQPRDCEIEFAVSPAARAGPCERVLVLRDAARREMARVKVRATVRPAWLDLTGAPDFGPLEPGDVVERPLAFRLCVSGAQALPFGLTPRDLPAVTNAAPERAAAEWLPGTEPGAGRLRCRIPADARAGQAEGSLTFEAGPARGVWRWSGEVLIPRWELNPQALDFGALLPGQSRRLELRVRFEGARPTPLSARAEAPFAKPRLAHIQLRASALTVLPPAEALLPGGEALVAVQVQVPDDAQDGAYQTRVTVGTRLGARSVPVALRVLSPVHTPPFHVLPPEVSLRVEEGGPPPPTAKVFVLSHRDEDQAVNVSLEPVEGSLRPCAELVLSAGRSTGPATLALPGRGEAEFLLAPLLDARDGERCEAVLEIGGERQVVRVHVEHPGLAAPAASPPAPPRFSLLDWFRFLFLLLLVLAVLLVRVLIRRPYVRYFAYVTAGHAALFSIALPEAKVLSVLPEGVQVSLSEWQETLGLANGAEQQWRQGELGAHFRDLTATSARPDAAGAAPRFTTEDLPPDHASGRVAAQPAASAELPAAPVSQPRAGPAPEPRREAASAAPDEALAAGAAEPEPRSAAPLESAPVPRAAGGAPRLADAPRVTLPAAMAARDAAPGPAGPAGAVTEVETPLPPERTAPGPAVARATRETFASDDAPLVAEKVAPVSTKASAGGGAGGGAPAAAAGPRVVGEPVRFVAEGPADVAVAAPPTRAGSGEAVVSEVEPRWAGEGGGGGGGSGTRRGPLGMTPREGGLGSGDMQDAALAAGPGPARPGTRAGAPGVSPSEPAPGGGGVPGLWGRGTGDGRDLPEGPGGGLGPGLGPSAGPSGRGGVAGLFGEGGGGTGFGSGLAGGGGGTGGGTGTGNGTGSGSGTGAGAGTGRGGGQGGGVGSGTGDGAGRGGPGGLSGAPAAGGAGGETAGGPGGRGAADLPIAAEPMPERPRGAGGAGGTPPGTGAATGVTGSGASGAGTAGGGRGVPAAGPGWPFAPGGPGAGAGSGSGTGGGGAGGFGSGATGLGAGRGGGEASLQPPGGKANLASQVDTSALERAARRAAHDGLETAPRLVLRPAWGGETGTTLRVTLGLARHSGDWNSSPTALHHLATAFRERCGIPEAQVSVRIVGLGNPQELAECRVVLITSNDPILLTSAEVQGARAYVLSGGLLWVNDSSASTDERFDKSFRREVQRIFWDVPLETLSDKHPLLVSAYDLSRGYKGYKIPPGDKYREDSLHGVTVQDARGFTRLGVLYTRNDYADGLEIDPRMSAGMKSLTDLAADEMLEGARRFGINVVAYALGAVVPRLPEPVDVAAEIEKLYRYKGPALPVVEDFKTVLGQDGKPLWSAEDWGNPARAAQIVMPDGAAALQISFESGDKLKAVVSRLIELDLASARALVLDLHSALPNGFHVALLFQTRPDWKGYESRPLFVRPGWNRNLRFPLTLDDFKSSDHQWKDYISPLENRGQVGRLAFLIYNHTEKGQVLIQSVRVEK